FLAGDRMAITLWNPGEAAEQVHVVAPGYRLEQAEWQDPAWTGPAHSIRPKEVALLIFRRQSR
ncbi:MAG TPA: hypothetical protein VG672_07280, partial [Bryobacteraceae bacterium]|nr:hypothetical protein [Bryobacteraceae bacterium]